MEKGNKGLSDVDVYRTVSWLHNSVLPCMGNVEGAE